MDFPAFLLPYREAILAMAKPAATFKPLPASSVIDPKASKMGGIPFTPRYTDWPSSMIQEGLVSHKRPQAFVGQFNFGEIVKAVPELNGAVPSAGLLQLFYDLEEFPWRCGRHLFAGSSGRPGYRRPVSIPPEAAVLLTGPGKIPTRNGADPLFRQPARR